MGSGWRDRKGQQGEDRPIVGFQLGSNGKKVIQLHPLQDRLGNVVYLGSHVTCYNSITMEEGKNGFY